jgi:hypothetical protein
MAFRSDPRAPSGGQFLADPLARFRELFAALDQPSRMWTDRVPLRLAAINLITVPGDPEQIAGEFYTCDADLAGRLGMFTGTDPAVRRVISSQLLKSGDTPAAFVVEVDRVRALFRERKIRRGGVYETLAVLVLRRALQGAAIETAHVERFQAIYEAMKRHHWWLTGPEDFPACAMLVGRPGEPAAIGDGIEAIYGVLRDRVDLWPGDALQTAANVLYVTGAPALDLADRFALLAAGFRANKITVGIAEYDDVAMLCMLSLPVDKIVATVTNYRDQLAAASWFTGRGHFSLATNLAFVHLVGSDPALGSLADAKLLLDMQAITAARQASG